MKKLLIVLLCFSSVAFAEAESSVIDLGDLSVKGEVRRPATRFYQLKSMHPKQLEEFSELDFEELETRLLQMDVTEGDK